MWAHKRLYTRVFIYLYLLLIALMTCFGVFVYTMAATTLKNQLANKCAGIATAVAVMLEQDADGYREFSETLKTHSPYYIRTKKKMEAIREGNRDNIIFLYTEKRLSDTEMMFILDGEPTGSADFSPPGTQDAMTAPRREAYQNRALAKGDFVTTRFGTLLSAYAPIFDHASGDVLGLVGVDVSIDQFRGVMNYYLVVIVASIGIMVLMMAVALFLSSSSIAKKITLDNLTGVYNKAFFLHSLKRQAVLSKRKDEPLLVVMTDLDHFKRINDTYGHPFGDEVLVAVAKAFKSALRDSDCLARYGGEEFVAYFPGLTSQNASFVLERIHQMVKAATIHNLEHDTSVSVTVSIGAAFLGINQTVAEVLENADKALYAAKKTRDTIMFYTPKNHSGHTGMQA